MVNNVTLVGRITKDPEVKIIGEGTAVCNFTLAVNRPYKNKDGEKEADFIQCQVWNKQAEFVGSYVKKGHLISVIGSINTRTYDREDGTKAYVTEVNGNQVTSFETKGEKAEAHNYKSLEEVKAAQKKEWDIRSVGLDASSKSNLKKELTKKYQPIIDEFESDNPF